MAMIVLCVLYGAVLLTLSSFGIHRLHLVLLCWRHRKAIAAAQTHGEEAKTRWPNPDLGELPMVTIQLPLFNESTVVKRLVRAVAEMDYPRERLHIQVLDDSTDETTHLAQREVERLQQRGYLADYIHRVDRTGYKAGALDNGLATARGELVAMFDADFVPDPSFVRSLVDHFRDPAVGMVQARWAHLNRESSVLTRVQALMLDGHHLVENRARFGAGLFFNFSGTGGMWRQKAIFDAGGWQHDTLTEDLDLSYRAQLAGWKFIYRPDVVSPAELPEDISALRAQQYRWAKGTVQTARKLAPTLRNAGLSWTQRIEAAFHLTPHFAYPLMVALIVLLLPIVALIRVESTTMMLLLDVPLCMAPIGSLASFYMLAERAQGRSAWRALAVLPMLVAVGAGIAPHLTKAVFDGWRNPAGEFVRTPKRGAGASRYEAKLELPLAELACAVWSGTAAVVGALNGHWFAVPFASLFTIGFAYMAGLLLLEGIERRRDAASPAVMAPQVVAQLEPSTETVDIAA